MNRLTGASTGQKEPEQLDETSAGIAVRGCLRKYKDDELCGIAQDQSTLMTSESGVGRKREGPKVALVWSQGELIE